MRPAGPSGNICATRGRQAVCRRGHDARGPVAVVQAGTTPAGAEHYGNALALAEPRGMRPLIAHCLLGLGRLYRRTGRPAEATDHLERARTKYREMGMAYWLERAQSELAELG